MKWNMTIPLAIFASLLLAGCAQTPANDVALGTDSIVKQQIDVPINPPQELDFQTKQQILAARTKTLAQYEKLFAAPYKPSSAVFGQIEDGRPWWGLEGEAYYGKGEKSIAGPAEESRFVMNPLLLVGDSNAGMRLWDKQQVSEARLREPSFPLYCKFDHLTWQPAQRRASVTYHASAYLDSYAAYSGVQPPRNGNIQLEAINARDLGLHYILIPPQELFNIATAAPMSKAMAIPQYIHCGGSCGYEGGCNNMSPGVPELDNLRFVNLPARLKVHLWKKMPEANEAPDMVYTINYD